MGDTLRTTFRFNAEEASFAERLRQPDSDEAQVVREITGLQDLKHAPNATLLHTIVEAGIKAIQDRASELSYQRAVEADAQDPDRVAWRNAMRSRRLGSSFAEGVA